MLGSHTTDDGYTLEVFSSLYMDWGLRIIDPEGNQVFYNPCCLSNDSYGHKPREGLDWDEAEEADAFEPWTEEDWVEMLREEANTFLEAYVTDAV